jgi:hypothetical protein
MFLVLHSSKNYELNTSFFLIDFVIIFSCFIFVGLSFFLVVVVFEIQNRTLTCGVIDRYLNQVISFNSIVGIRFGRDHENITSMPYRVRAGDGMVL